MLDINEIVTAWIQRYENLKAKAETQWAYNELDDLSTSQPEVSIKIIFSIFENTQNEFVLDNLAAGPLEDVLARQGVKVIDDIEQYVKVNPDFCDVLSGIWENKIPVDILKRINLLLNSKT